MIEVTILDSSFNPPTLAHNALALARSPSYQPHHVEPARLLLLSVRNVDKSLRPGDATYTQRVEMMIAAAKDMSPSTNVAVAVIDEPSFVGKSTKVINWFAQRNVDVRLTFVLGTDTITRFFEPRYYPSESAMRVSIQHFFKAKEEGGDDSRVICVKRHSDNNFEDIDAFLGSAEVHAYILSGQIHVLEIGTDEAMMSSTAVRKGVPIDGMSSSASNRMCSPGVISYIQDRKLYSG